ncbi:MAG: hypothetical protein LUC47_04640 [Clostridiales bacterium]|nr:hypothetical protein [Clostridiales bacterium]
MGRKSGYEMPIMRLGTYSLSDVEAYLALEQADADGKVHSIGLSNWYVEEMEEFLPQVYLWMYLLPVGSLTMGNALQATGAGTVIGDALANVVGGLGNRYLVGLVFFLVPFLLTQFMKNRTVMQVFIPIAALACQSMGANPVGIVILV